MNTTAHQTNWILPLAVGIALVFLGAGLSNADTLFLDDFNDGDAHDGIPATWTEHLANGDYDATSGDYVFAPRSDFGPMFASVVDITSTDFSIRTQVRTSSDLGSVYVSARLQDPLASPSIGNYFGGIGYDSNSGGTTLRLGRFENGTATFFGGFPLLPFDVRTEDAVLQLDVIGNELKLWGWKAGDPMPDQPQLTATDNTFSGGTMRIYNDVENLNIATFRYVHVADMHIPEPSALALAALGLLGLIANGRRRHTT